MCPRAALPAARSHVRITSTFPVFRLADELVGNFFDAQGKMHGFVRLASGYHQIDIPGATSTTITAVNKAATLVGYYFVAGVATFGFMAHLPRQPSALLAIGGRDARPPRQCGGSSFESSENGLSSSPAATSAISAPGLRGKGSSASASCSAAASPRSSTPPS